MKPHFFFLSVKKHILPALFVVFTLCLIIFSKENLSATKNGLLLWANSVVPALLPFFMATELLSHTGVVNSIGKLLNRYMKPIFNVPRYWCLCFYYGNYKWIPCWSKDCY